QTCALPILVHALQERVDVARLAASEAVVVAELGPHVEARAALVVERAEALERADARGLEADVLAQEVCDVRAGLDLIDVALSNAARHGSHPIARNGCRGRTRVATRTGARNPPGQPARGGSAPRA